MSIFYLIINASSMALSGDFFPPRMRTVNLSRKCFLLIRCLVMDLCLGSMLDFCLSKLPLVQNLDIAMIMWETARGLEYLHNNKIVHGSLALEKILLWRKRPKSKPIVKVGGYMVLIPNSSTKVISCVLSSVFSE